MQRTKRGNPHHLPKKRRKRGQRVSPPAVRQVAPAARARLTLHETDPITGHEDTLYTLFYECYRGYTIYSTQEGSCCIHGKQGCLRLRGKFMCFPDVEEAKTLIKQFRAEGYTSYDPVERHVPEGEYMCLNRGELQRTPTLSRPMQRVS
jgi:hypothetical protein